MFPFTWKGNSSPSLVRGEEEEEAEEKKLDGRDQSLLISLGSCSIWRRRIDSLMGSGQTEVFVKYHRFLFVLTAVKVSGDHLLKNGLISSRSVHHGHNNKGGHRVGLQCIHIDE